MRGRYRRRVRRRTKAEGRDRYRIGQLRTAITRLSGIRGILPEMHRAAENSVTRRFIERVMIDLGEADVHLRSALKSTMMDGF